MKNIYIFYLYVFVYVLAKRVSAGMKLVRSQEFKPDLSYDFCLLGCRVVSWFARFLAAWLLFFEDQQTTLTTFGLGKHLKWNSN